MANNTNINLRNKVIYSIYIRSHTVEGTFKSIIEDLDRINNLGVDIIWLMPIHPCGDLCKKGSMGSPYAVSHYREVNPEYGTKEDFIELVNEIHKRDMKCIIDVVYNHTSPDAWLVDNHPEFYFLNKDGRFGSKVDDWTDVFDLDFNNRTLWDYLIKSLEMWAEIVDGFRCDVAPLIPIEFWLQARSAVDAVKPNAIWLAETVESSFIKLNRKNGFLALSDSETYQAFDITYDYDVINYMRDYLEGKQDLNQYIEILNLQDTWYPSNFVKLRFLENHDRPRIKTYINNENDLLNWTAFLYFQKGTTLIYAGQETQNTLKPSLFETEKTDWSTENDISGYLKSLYDIKQDPLFSLGDYTLKKDDKTDTIIGCYYLNTRKIIGIFPVKSEYCDIYINSVKDGSYINQIDNNVITVNYGVISTNGKAVIFKTTE